ncbi:DUF2510 domain-containing protein [Ilumatobacter sp.]|uniref:DUF2510 domain-containing protein n=1 Tax=Ilumatobacter sp. TaxID=1967498 RepID=UPI003C467E9C
MRYADAPAAGWYPDPEHRSRLRWWDGFDWTDIRRAPPSGAELIAAEENRQFFENARAANPMPMQTTPAGYDRQNSEQIISEVRAVAREELDRAAEQFSQRATNAVRSVTPLISGYTSQIAKWIRRAIIIALVLLVAYFVFQVVMQASFFDWLGDRIDNVTNPPESLGALGQLGSGRVFVR